MSLFIIIALLFSPSAQLGVSFWLSGATAILICVLMTVRFKALYSYYSSHTQDLLLDAVCVVLMIMPMIIERTDDFSHDILLNLRLILFYVLLVIIIRGYSTPNFFKIKDNKAIAATIMIVAGAMFIFALVQLVKLRGGYFGLPKAWYVTNYEQLPGELDILWAKSFRPFCTFGEPSYLAFFCISLLMPTFRMCLTKKYRKIGVITGIFLLGTGAASQSMAFLSALAIIGIPAIYIYTKSTKITGTALGGVVGIFSLAAGIVLLAGVAALKFAGINILGDRLGNIASGGDISTSLRILAPIAILPKIFVTHPFGMPGSTILDTVLTDTSEAGFGSVRAIDNALFNTIFYFGLGAFFIIYRLFKAAGNWLTMLYLFTCFNFNGEIFHVDKVAIIGVSIILTKAFAEASARSEVRTVPRLNPSPKFFRVPLRRAN